MIRRAAVALGSNLGDRIGHLRHAVAALSETGVVVGVSSLYETDPVGGPEQDPYLNAVAVLDTELGPGPLMSRLLEIEADRDRVREIRWGPRTLDLDIVCMTAGGEAVTSSDSHVLLPHPRAAERRFVLAPLAEVWPSAPLGSVTAAELLPATADQKVRRIASRWMTPGRSWVPGALVVVQFVLLAVFALIALVTRTGVSGWGLVGGSLVVGVGAALGLLATRALGPALTPLPEPKPGTRLVDVGPYRFVRHPIYTSVILILLGASWVTGSWWGAVAAVSTGVFFWLKARYEESRLTVSVPGYPDYRERVRGRLLWRP